MRVSKSYERQSVWSIEHILQITFWFEIWQVKAAWSVWDVMGKKISLIYKKQGAKLYKCNRKKNMEKIL
jgi:hypothetical protein